MKLPDLTNLKENFYLQFFALFGAVFLFVGKPVPYSNEFSYLLRLRKVYRPELSGKRYYIFHTGERILAVRSHFRIADVFSFD